MRVPAEPVPVCIPAQPKNRLPAVVDGSQIARVNVCGAASRWRGEKQLSVSLKVVDPPSSVVQTFGLGWVALPMTVSG